MSGEALVFAVFLIPIGRTAVKRLCNWNRPTFKVLLSLVLVEITKVVELLGGDTGADATEHRDREVVGIRTAAGAGWLTILLP